MDATQAIHAYLTTAESSGFRGESVDLLNHWQGVDNLLWRFECDAGQFVLKLFIDAGQVRSRRQFDGQQLFHPAGFACRPLWYDWQPDGLARPVLIYEWAEGSALGFLDEANLRQTARILADIHAADVADVGRLSPIPVSLDYFWRLMRSSIGKIDEWLCWVEATALHAQFGALAESATTLVERALPLAQGAPPTAIHGDPKLENFVEAGDVITLLDWELFGLGDPALEAAKFLFQSQAELDETQRSEWLSAYLTHAEQPGLETRIGAYQHLLPFQSVCFLLDGLRDYGLGRHALAQRQDELAFLQATLRASLTQAAEMLAITHQEYEATTAVLFERLGQAGDL